MMKAGKIEKRQITLAKSDLEFMSGVERGNSWIETSLAASVFSTDS
jgi:hypothetical protein